MLETADLSEFAGSVVATLKDRNNAGYPFDLSPDRDLYFIGIGGIGMSSVAGLLKNRGFGISGSDMFANSVTTHLEHLGVKINFKQNGQSIDNKTDLIVTSAAIPENNLDLVMARKLGIKIIKYSQLLGMLMKDKKGIAISGTHGKTTTTAMVSSVLKSAGLDPSCVIGGETPVFEGNYCSGKSDLFVTEACEYDRTFLNLVPQIAVITNIDEDHLDCYRDLNELQAVFAEFASSINPSGLLVINEKDYSLLKDFDAVKCRVETFAVENENEFSLKFGNKKPKLQVNCVRKTVCTAEMVSGKSTWIAERPVFRDGKTCFNVFYRGKLFGHFSISKPGVHNVMNALASIAIGNYLGVEMEVIRDSLAVFNGVDRRFQTLGTVNDITIIDDYAHHPTAIQATLSAARERYPDKRIWCLFQPHQYSRTRQLMDRFVKSFRDADKVIFSEIYAARDSTEHINAVSSADVVARIKELGIDVAFISSHSQIVRRLGKELCPGDVLIVMGAGDIWRVGVNVLSALRTKSVLEGDII